MGIAPHTWFICFFNVLLGVIGFNRNNFNFQRFGLLFIEIILIFNVWILIIRIILIFNVLAWFIGKTYVIQMIPIVPELPERP